MFEKCIYFNSNALARTVSRLWEEAYGQYDLSPAHAYLLRMVLTHPGLLPREIADGLDLSRSTITRFLNSLQKRGYLVRRASEHDGRAFEVHPTQKAIDLHEALDETARSLTKTAIELLGQDYFSDMVIRMRTVKDSFE